jgi:glycosyltransferase involved in cell wall biosynthesis
LAYGLITQTVWPLRVVSQIAKFRTMSEFARGRLIDMGVIAEKIQVVPNFVPQPGLLPERTASPTWVYMGHLGEEKGISVAVDAFAAGAPGELIVIGGGPLESTLRDRVIRDRLPITVTGHIEGDARLDVLRRAWGLIFPSLCFENGPIAILEALSLGVPVIASNLGSIPEYVQDGVSGRLFRAGDPTDLVRVLSDLARSSATQERLSEGASAVYDARFSEARILHELEALLADIVHSHT